MVSGLVAQVAADAFGDIGPFRAAVVVTAIAAAFIFSWSENYGLPSENANKQGRKAGTSENTEAKCSGRLLTDAYALGFCNSLFEGAMYVFGMCHARFSSLIDHVLILPTAVFLWYPTLEVVVPNGDLPSGLVFSSFMLCMAIGGKLFDLVNNSWLNEELLLLVTTAASAASLLIPTVRLVKFFVLSAVAIT